MKPIFSGKILLVAVLIIGIFAGMALPVGAVEDTTLNVTVSNTPEVMDPEDRTGDLKTCAYNPIPPLEDLFATFLFGALKKKV